MRYFEQTDAQDKLEFQPCRREGMFLEQEHLYSKHEVLLVFAEDVERVPDFSVDGTTYAIPAEQLEQLKAKCDLPAALCQYVTSSLTLPQAALYKVRTPAWRGGRRVGRDAGPQARRRARTERAPSAHPRGPRGGLVASLASLPA